MKNYRRILAVVLTVVLAACLLALPVMAADETGNGLELTLTTDKTEYASAEAIHASLTVKNTTETAVSELLMQHDLAEGVTVKQGEVQKFVASLGAGESVSLDVTLEVDVAAETGDFAVSAVAVALVVSGLGVALLCKDAKVRKSVISVFLCCLMVGGLFAAVPVRADSAVQTVSTVIKVNGEEMTFSASVAQVTGYSEIRIDALTNGTVTTDKQWCKIGETVTLTVNPDEGYAQKLYINGEPVLLNWKNNAYTFVAEQSSYVISGDFVQSLSLTPLDEARWDDANHAHGILNTYYPSNVDSWWININGEYKAFEITAKNYLPVEDSKDDGANGVDGYQQMIRMALSNGKTYAFRIYNDKGTYAVSCTGQSGSATGWTNWKKIDDAAAAAMNGDGVQFKLERTAANTLTVSVNDTVLITYTMDGVTEADKVVSVGVLSFYNQGKYVDIPFELTTPAAENDPPVTDDGVTLTIGEFTNGTVTADKESYEAGDTVTLTVAPADGYAQKLYLNGEAILVDTNSQYSFVVEAGKTYAVTGEFVTKSGWFWTADYGMLNQAHGVVYAPAVTEKNGELVPTANKCYGGRVLVKDPSGGTKKDYAIVLKMAFSDGTSASVRLVNKDGAGAYMVQSMSGLLGEWKWYYDLTAEENAAVASGEGVWFGLVREGTTIKLTVNGSEKTRADVTVNIPENVVLNQFKLQTYNFSYPINVAYEFYMTE